MQSQIPFKRFLKNTLLTAMLVGTSSGVFAQINPPEMSIQYLGAIGALDTDNDEEYEAQVAIFDFSIGVGAGELASNVEHLRNEDGQGNSKTVYELGGTYPLSSLPVPGFNRGVLNDVHIVVQYEQEDPEGGAADEQLLYGFAWEHDIDLLDEFRTLLFYKEVFGDEDRIRVSLDWLHQLSESPYNLYLQGFMDIESNTKDSEFTVESRIQIMADIGQQYLGDEALFIGLGLDVQENTEEDYHQATPQLFVQFNF